MKKIEAIIRREKFAEVRDALHKNGIDFFSYWDVTGQGREREGVTHRGTTYQTDFIQRRLMKIIVRDENCHKTVQTIIKIAGTGEIGDGKVIVSNIEESYRIRNGETGPDSLKAPNEE